MICAALIDNGCPLRLQFMLSSIILSQIITLQCNVQFCPQLWAIWGEVPSRHGMSIASIQELHGCNVVVLDGAPFVGRNTQGRLLGKILEWSYVSAEDLFPAEVALGSDLGRQITAYADSGELIPNERKTVFLTTNLSDSIYRHWMILDGYPYRLWHLPVIEEIFANLDRRSFTAIYLDERRLCRGWLDDNAEISERCYAISQEERPYLSSNNKLMRIDCSALSFEQVVHQ